MRYIIVVMDYYENIKEYYDELFPVTPEVLTFIDTLRAQLKKDFNIPGLIRVLDVECTTGVLDQQLVSRDFDVTGFDSSPSLLESAIRRKKQPYTNSRFLEMSMLDMGRYLCRGSFHIVLCMENRLVAIDDETLLRKFFVDSFQVLAPGGYLVLELLNFKKIADEHISQLPDRSSVRITFSQHLQPSSGGLQELHGELSSETSARYHDPVCMMQYPLTPDELGSMAKAAGFTNVRCFADFNGQPFTGNELSYVAVLQKQ